MTEDYTGLTNVIAAHRLIGFLSLIEANRMYLEMFKAKNAGRPAPSFGSLLRKVRTHD